ncbi:MarR family transcriptional regulator [Burkholderia sp. MSh2]|uniref:MarR family transcriptional regulator n=1 Tax=Burkholderia paludis TaxID=1506587 RepID=A0A6J5DRN3_9BURK|nr:MULTISPECIES: helix-turn-helix domain-containing protein [Burkholderia]KEZ06066.1 MarR family transcriptional regulator [Burkholderia sp. MSh2]KFG96700.1 MarR family transcriptional regulator [Burkholderia paludis]CAB3755595.1 putative HTH-type transcriptional regulator [Burkholderia paludis]VWB37131.1 MarR family transcriptional regulator [Burkholderia paludis]
MKSKSFDGMTCSIASVLDALGDRWSLLIVRDLALGLARYDDLHQSTGVTHATLSDRLKALEGRGLIERRLYQSRPERYEYHLTQRGRDIGIVLMALAQVGDAWGLAESKAPPLCFTEARSGHAVRLAAVDAETGKPVDMADLRVEAGPGADDIMHWRLEKTRARRNAS